MAGRMDSDKYCDVVVVGGGGSGLAAAIEAASHGGRVVLVEKNAELGGTTVWAVGSFSASRTEAQRRMGVVDTVEDHMEDMGRFAGELAERDNLPLRRLFAERSGETLEWLRGHGLVFLGPMEEPPHRRPRMYNVLPGSRAYIHRLGRVAAASGVDIRRRTTAVRLLITGARVCGVECEGPDGVLRLHASKGVVLAAGDFSASRELKERYIGSFASTVDAVNPSTTGAGIQLGLAAGGRVVNGDLALGPELRFVPPPGKGLLQRLPPVPVVALAMKTAAGLLPGRMMRRIIMGYATTYLAPSRTAFELGALLVNGDGRRFVDESVNPQDELPGQPDGIGWIVLDGRVAHALNTPPYHVSTAPGIAYAFLDDYRRNRKDLFHEAETIEGLAASMGVSAANLTASIAEVNTARGLAQGCRVRPFIALGPVRSLIVLTEGGLAIDEQCRVLGDDGPIGGLYAAGSNGQGGLILEGHGNHIGWAFVSGRTAGKAAMDDGSPA